MKKNYIYALGAMSVVSLGLIGCGQADVENGIQLNDIKVSQEILNEIETLDTRLIGSGVHIDYNINPSDEKSEHGQMFLTEEKSNFNRLEAANNILALFSKAQNGVDKNFYDNQAMPGIEEFVKNLNYIEESKTVAKIIFDLLVIGFNPKSITELLKHEFLQPETLLTPRYMSFNAKNITWEEGENEEANEAIKASAGELIALKDRLEEANSELEHEKNESRGLMSKIEILEAALKNSNEKLIFFSESLDRSNKTNESLVSSLSKLYDERLEKEKFVLELRSSQEEIEGLRNSLIEFKSIDRQEEIERRGESQEEPSVEKVVEPKRSSKTADKSKQQTTKSAVKKEVPSTIISNTEDF